MNEQRSCYNFSLNQVGPSHTEIPLPGVHSDIGGGYPEIIHEHLLVAKPRTILWRRGRRIDPQATPQWQEREEDVKRLVALGLPGDGRLYEPRQAGRLQVATI